MIILRGVIKLIEKVASISRMSNQLQYQTQQQQRQFQQELKQIKQETVAAIDKELNNIDFKV